MSSTPGRVETETKTGPVSGGDGGNDPSDRRQGAEDKAKDRAKIRRAQVRRAQIQHRQRKADYVKQLELDVTHFRELIVQVERETAELTCENEGLSERLRAVGVPTWDAQHQQLIPLQEGYLPIYNEMDQGQDLMTSAPPSGLGEQPDMFADINIDDLTVTLSQDDDLGTPCFHISSNSSSGSDTMTSPSRSDGSAGLTTAQEHMAINFILSLEHICWDHFFLGDFPAHHEPSEAAMGHTLMASTFCMASAPESVFMGRRVVGPVSSTCVRGRKPLQPDPNAPRIFFQWPAPAISLESVHGLAAALNPGGELELTPVQAWFELMGRYPADTLFDERLLDELRMQLNGVVKCLSFGAVIERWAFESVVGRVFGPPPEGGGTWMAFTHLQSRLQQHGRE